MKTVAKRRDPELWERSKKKACTKYGLCKHSARKMQRAVQIYKAEGGRYTGPKRSDNSMRLWTNQRWRTASGKKSNGKLRYLPDRAWANLSPEQIRRTNRAKAAGFRKGKQYVRQPSDVAKIARRYRTQPRR